MQTRFPTNDMRNQCHPWIPWSSSFSYKVFRWVVGLELYKTQTALYENSSVRCSNYLIPVARSGKWAWTFVLPAFQDNSEKFKEIDHTQFERLSLQTSYKLENVGDQ